MSAIMLAQYFTHEFLHSDKTVISVAESDEPITAIIGYEDGTTQKVNGKIASDILKELKTVPC